MFKNSTKNILKSFLFLHLIIRCYSEALVYQNFFRDVTVDWFYSKKHQSQASSTCQSKLLFGGYVCFNEDTYILKTFELKPHYQLRLKFLFWRIDWEALFLVYVDNIEMHKQYFSGATSSSNFCGLPYKYDETFLLDLTTYHQSPTAQILITSTSWWGISDFELFIEECPKDCDSCGENGCFNQILYIQYFTAKTFNQVDFNEGWSDQNGITYVNRNIVADYSIYELQSLTSTKTINLPDHDAVSISMKIITFNLYHQCDIFIDEVLVSSSTLLLQVQIDKRNYDWDYNYLITNQINIQQYRHIKNLITLTIRINPSLRQTSLFSSDYLAMRDFQIFIKKNYDCFDGNIYPFDGCFAKIYDCVEGCVNCVRGVCLKCQQGWQYYEQNKMCLPVCGNSIITYFEECDDGNTQQYDGCYQCKYSCPLNCSVCQFGKCKLCQPRYRLIYGQCKYFCNGSESQEEQEDRGCYNNINNLIENGHYQHNLFNNLNSKYKLVSNLTCSLYDFGIFGYFYNQCRIQAIQNCRESLIGKCLECEKFYESKNIKSSCTPICNDGIAIEQELCDDENNLYFDGCQKCQQSCQFECLNCIGSECYECLDGWQLLDYRCYQYCGDGEVAVFSTEQCDDGNKNNGDGCFECKFECAPYCQQCVDSYACIICEQYFELQNNSCKPICGDEHIVIELEECEDGNNIPYDGCFECQFNCQAECTDCQQGVCQACEIQGWSLSNQSCHSICGDGFIVMGLEECEDGNNIPYDGCFNCMFQCQQECQNCNQGICIGCIEGYIILNDYCEVDNQTHIIVDEDDAKSNYDDCSSMCQIETNWFCNNSLNQPSVCIPNTVLKLDYLNQTQQIQYIQLSFTNKVKLNETISNFTNSIKSSIPSIQENIYIITIIPVVKIDQTNLLDTIYVFQIQILESITTQIYLEVEINASLVDQNEQQVNMTLQTIKLSIPKVLNINQLQTANKLKSLGSWMMIGLASSSLFLFFAGNLLYCLEILDILQFQSYLRFINVEFPQNILIYFETSEYVTINPLLIKLKVNDFFQELIGYQYLDSVGKLFEYELNADLLVNIYGQFTQIVLLIGLYIFTKYFKKIVYTNFFGNKYIYYVRLVKIKLIKTLGFKLYYFSRYICKINDYYNLQGLIKFFNANSWDLIFKILMYMISIKQLGIREIISNVISILYLLSMIIILIQNFKGYNRKVKLKDIRTKLHEEIILLKKFLFLVVLIVVQSYPLLQCILLTFILFWYIGILITFNFTSNKLDLLIIIWIEAPVMIFTLSCLIYCSDFEKYFSINQQIITGFIQISILIFALTSPFVRCGYQIYCKVRAYYLKSKIKKQRMKVKAINIFFIATETT